MYGEWKTGYGEPGADGPMADPSDNSVRVHKAVAVVVETHERLGHLLAKLAERLTPVLRPHEPREVDAKLAEVRTPVSPLANALDEQAAHARAMADQVEDLLRRLEV